MDLIFDRTIEDVNYALSHPDSTEFLKGSYNYTDLNRIESNCEYIVELVNDIGLLPGKINLELKIDWKVTDIPTLMDINRIRNNVKILLEKLNIVNFEEIVFDNTMDYKKANALEKNLFLLKEQFKKFNKEIRICGTFNCGEGGIYGL